jgi:hypothetical protein
VLVGETLLLSGLQPTLRAYATKNGNPAGEMPTPGLLAVAPAVAHSPARPQPLVVVVSRDLEKGTAAFAITRDVDPPIVPAAPLPNPVAVPPLISPPTDPAPVQHSQGG